MNKKPSQETKLGLFIMSALIAIALGVAMVSMINSITQADYERAESAAMMGDVLTFPAGWEPAFCESNWAYAMSCRWVCRNPQDDTYRYCTPTVYPANLTR